MKSLLSFAGVSILLLSSLVMIIPSTLATGNVCSQGLYPLFQPLSKCADAISYCSSHFTVTVTATPAPTKLKRAKATSSSSSSSSSSTSSTITAQANAAKTKSTKSAATTTMSTSTQDPLRVLLSSLVQEADAFVATVCSCIGGDKTVTVTPTPTYQSPPTCPTASFENGSQDEVRCGPDDGCACFKHWTDNVNYCVYTTTVVNCHSDADCAAYSNEGPADNPGILSKCVIYEPGLENLGGGCSIVDPKYCINSSSASRLFRPRKAAMDHSIPGCIGTDEMEVPLV